MKRLFTAVYPRSVTAQDGGVRPRPMTAEDWAAMRQRRRRLRQRFRLRMLGMGRAGWIAVGVLLALWTVGTLL
ncbi:MAG TPA: hypothetical protein VEK55_00580 [Xanthobacteraceae bacterium]|nr:hypothetical protein [Xanthobacteraceae bacterium]